MQSPPQERPILTWFDLGNNRWEGIDVRLPHIHFEIQQTAFLPKPMYLLDLCDPEYEDGGITLGVADYLTVAQAAAEQIARIIWENCPPL